MKTYPCPYCKMKLTRDKLVDHIEKEHDDLIPVNYTAYRVVYDIVNNKHGHGECTICHKDTNWNEKRQKYERLCGDPKCYDEVRKTYEKRMIKVYNKTSLLDDPQMQEKMLANRKISGKYKWSDGTEFTYTGSYEKKLMEFLDKTMEYKSNEIIAPGPVLEYEYNGKPLHWITDFLIIPYNLIIEVKDGGDNPNNRVMTTYREKQVAKEKMITNKGTFNYIRLTNNNFGQLLSILAELKKNCIEDNKDPIYRIHENYNENDEMNFEALYSFADDISEYSKRYLEENSKNYVFIEDNIHRIINHPKTDEEIVECVEITSMFKNKSLAFNFVLNINECINYLESLYPYDKITYYFKDESNPLNGVIIGLKTSY